MEALRSWNDSPPDRWVAFYVRVTKEESVQTDLSIPNQIARAKEVAAIRRWTAWQIYVEPKHVSGELWIDKRPAFRELLGDVSSGRVIAVCARHVDRLWRASEVQTRLLDILRQHGVELWDFSTRHDYKTAHGKFSLRVLGAAAELEVDVTSERIREMKRGKAHKGKVCGGPPPFGYTSQSRRILQLRAEGYSQDEAYARGCSDFPIGKRWYVDQEEASIVRRIFELYTSPEHRLGAKRIARYLNGHGFKTRNGLAWLANYVRRLLHNPSYAGFTSYDEEAYEKRITPSLSRDRHTLFKGEHEPLIPEALWRKAQALRGDGGTKRDGREDRPSQVFTLTGIIRCPSCGSRMIGKWTSHSTRLYYICSRRHNGGFDLCNFPLLDAYQIHQETWAWIHAILSSPSYLEEHLARAESRLQQARPQAEKDLARAHKEAEEVRASLQKYFKLFESSHDPGRDEMLMDRVKQLRAQLASLEAEEAALAKQAPPKRTKLTVEQLQSYLAMLREAAGQRPNLQKALFQELKRSHGFRVRPKSRDEVILSLQLPIPSDDHSSTTNLTSGIDRRLYSVVDIHRSPSVGPGASDPPIPADRRRGGCDGRQRRSPARGGRPPGRGRR
jgi:site-specific DNA recombinase